MITAIAKKFFGSRNERVLRRFQQQVTAINALEPSFQALSDEDLKAKTAEFRQRLEQGETLAQLLPEAFATVREASRRTLEMRHFDVQLIGGMVLHEGRIAEMRTGEGKTLAATLPAYLNALTGKGVHIVTVNDYLAKRDTEWMGPIYHFLGLTTATVVSGMPPIEKKQAYEADIIYGTNNEFGFDYLRDNMALTAEERVQRALHFAIVDEVDSILIDEARTPLIISGPSEESSQRYQQFNELVKGLTQQTDPEGEGDFTLDEKTRQSHLTEQGHQHVEQLLVEQGLLADGESLYAAHNISFLYYINCALRARHLFHRDVDYIVKGGEVVIVDEHTGRTMPGRRWSDGLHQALEAKEGSNILPENHTLASITFQNYFRLYDTLAGMTGTADTEAYEFQQIYGLEVNVIPPHKKVCRHDYPDQIYLNAEQKFEAILKEIKTEREKGRPILVGTASIETSEYLSKLLDKAKVKHQVLNAKFHEKEAHIIAEAGQPGAVTIATNMAGRGTDIVLGGHLQSEIDALHQKDQLPSDAQLEAVKTDWQQRHDRVVEAGGLHIIGTERHESRRIDNQLRGRSGRQGDPGSTRFFLSLEDNLIRIFASDRLGGMMRKLGMADGEAIEHSLITKAIENAQRKVEGLHFDARKQLLEYDNVANEQRQIIYKQRAELLVEADVSETIKALREDVVQQLLARFTPEESFMEQWDLAGLEEVLINDFNLNLPIQQWFKEEGFNCAILADRLLQALDERYQEKEQLVGATGMRQFEKTVMLQSIDMHWREHLAAMDHLRQGIFLRGYAQKNPRQEYKREAFLLFSEMIERFKQHFIAYLTSVVIQTEDALAAEEERRRQASPKELHFVHKDSADLNIVDGEELAPAGIDEHSVETAQQTVVRSSPKVGRNEQCPCGSGRKFKHCHGEIA